MKSRAETFGAWVALDDATLVALDREAARALGIDGGARWDDARAQPPPAPLEVHVAVTSRCPATCGGCYQDASPAGAHVPREDLVATLDALAEARVFTVAFGGGEPLARDDLETLAVEARARGIVPVVTTSGIGMTPARARALRAFAQVNVSHDGVAGGYRAVRGFDAAPAADRAIAMLVDAGVPVGVNLVLTRQNVGAVEATADHARALGARELQLLRYKPAGRAASADYLARRLTPAQADGLHALLARLAERHGDALSVRIDCALVPFLSPHVGDPGALVRWGVFGCEAGRHLAAVGRDGALRPCSFAHGGDHERVARGEWPARFRDDPALGAFRAFVAAPPEPCASCAIRAACRGGCKIVASHLEPDRPAGAGLAPDPECPRVRAHRSAADAVAREAAG